MPKFGQDVVEEEELDEERRVAQELGERSDHRIGDRLEAAAAQQREDETEDQRDGVAHRRRLQSHEQTDQRIGRIESAKASGEDGVPFITVHHEWALRGKAAPRRSFVSMKRMMTIRPSAMMK